MIDLVKVEEAKFAGNEIDAVIAQLKNRDITAGIVQMNELTVVEDGLVTPSGTFKMSEFGMKQFLRRLKPPIGKQYAWGVDTPQILYDINEIVEEDNREFMYRIEDRNVVGISPAHFQPVDNAALLTALKDKFDIKDITVAPHKMRLRVGIDMVQLGASDDDPIHAGIEIINSETGWLLLQSMYMTYRIVCSNGAIVADYDHKYVQEQKNRDQHTIIADFVNRLNDYSWQVGGLKEAIERMTITPNSDLDIMPRRLVTLSEEEESLDGYYGLLHMLKNIVGRDASSGILGSFNNDSLQYDTWNAITAAAKQFDVDKSRRLEVLGGVMLTYNMRKAA